jgi:hypothetical protein
MPGETLRIGVQATAKKFDRGLGPAPEPSVTILCAPRLSRPTALELLRATAAYRTGHTGATGIWRTGVTTQLACRTATFVGLVRICGRAAGVAGKAEATAVWSTTGGCPIRRAEAAGESLLGRATGEPLPAGEAIGAARRVGYVARDPVDQEGIRATDWSLIAATAGSTGDGPAARASLGWDGPSAFLLLTLLFLGVRPTATPLLAPRLGRDLFEDAQPGESARRRDQPTERAS